MKVKELLQLWRSYSEDDRISIYSINMINGKVIQLVEGIYKEVPYKKIRQYLDCEVEAFYEMHEPQMIEGKDDEVSTLQIELSPSYGRI